MAKLLGVNDTFIHRRFKVQVKAIVKKGVRVVRINQPGLTFEIPFSQMPKKFR